MNNPIVIAIISAGLSAFVTCPFQMINKFIDMKKEKRDKEEEKERIYSEKKEQVYIAVLDRLLQVRRGFDYSKEFVERNDEYKKWLDEQNQKYMEISPKLRLYASDTIFRLCKHFILYARFTYTPITGPKLSEKSKELYDIGISLVARFMQEDLGYRKYSKLNDEIKCPQCGRNHDLMGRCPGCKMSYDELLKMLYEDMENQKEDNENEVE